MSLPSEVTIVDRMESISPYGEFKHRRAVTLAKAMSDKMSFNLSYVYVLCRWRI